MGGDFLVGLALENESPDNFFGLSQLRFSGRPGPINGTKERGQILLFQPTAALRYLADRGAQFVAGMRFMQNPSDSRLHELHSLRTADRGNAAL